MRQGRFRNGEAHQPWNFISNSSQKIVLPIDFRKCPFDFEKCLSYSRHRATAVQNYSLGFEIDIGNCKGQAYKKASNMGGICNCMQDVIQSCCE